MDDQRTTQEVIHLLGEDVERCYSALFAAIDAGEKDADGNVDAEYEFHARQLIRAVFAYIEATTFSVKASSAWRCMEEDIDISPQERYFATDTEYDINERGEVVETTAKISLAKNIRFALALNRKAHKVEEPFDPSVEWWSCMREAIKIRDRLTHPKWPGDLDVSSDEMFLRLCGALKRNSLVMTQMQPNPLQGTAEKLRFPIPSRSAAPEHTRR